MDSNPTSRAEKAINSALKFRHSDLNLSNLDLTELPKSIGQLSHLATLNLTNNKLSLLPDTIGKLNQLISLKISDNQLTELPDSIKQLNQLTHLDLSANLLTRLPDGIGQLIQLTRLNLNDNQLTTLPDSIGQLSQLTHLYLRNNRLTVLPIKGIMLNNNIVCRLDENQFELPSRLEINEWRTAIRYNFQKNQESDYIEGIIKRWVKNPWFKKRRLGGLENLFLKKKTWPALFETWTMVIFAFIAMVCQFYIVFAIWAVIGVVLLLRTEQSTALGIKWGEEVIKAQRIKEENRHVLDKVTFPLRLVLYFVSTVAIKIAATILTSIRYPRITICAIPENFNYQTLSIDSSTPPELIPGSECAYGKDPNSVYSIRDIRYTHKKKYDTQRGSSINALFKLNPEPLYNQIVSGLFFVIAWWYRWSLKSTALIYWPLYTIHKTPKILNHSDRQPLIALVKDYVNITIYKKLLKYFGLAVVTIFIFMVANPELKKQVFLLVPMLTNIVAILQSLPIEGYAPIFGFYTLFITLLLVFIIRLILPYQAGKVLNRDPVSNEHADKKMFLGWLKWFRGTVITLYGLNLILFLYCYEFACKQVQAYLF